MRFLGQFLAVDLRETLRVRKQGGCDLFSRSGGGGRAVMRLKARIRIPKSDFGVMWTICAHLAMPSISTAMPDSRAKRARKKAGLQDFVGDTGTEPDWQKWLPSELNT